MKYEEIETRVSEIEEISTMLRNTLERARSEFVESQVEMRFIRQLGEIERFAVGLLESAKKSTSQEELNSIFVTGIEKMIEHARVESTKIKEKLPAMRERVAVLESFSSFLDDKKVTLIGKKEAIERVINEEGDPRHPEKISTLREAERVRKNRKQNDS